MKLKSNHEIVGIISEIKLGGSHIKLVFTVASEVELPSNAFAYEQLKAVLGKRVGILNVDDQFFIREI